MAIKPEKPVAHGAKFTIQRLYLSSVSFDAKNSLSHFSHDWKPKLSIELHTENKEQGNSLYSVSLSVTCVVTNLGETVYTIKVTQSGTFEILDIKGSQLEHVLESFCPNLLYPYIREVISSEVTRAGFPQLVIAPVNFDAIYKKKKAEKEA